MKRFIPERVESDNFIFEAWWRHQRRITSDREDRWDPLRILSTAWVKVCQEIVDLQVEVKEVGFEFGQVDNWSLKNK